MAKKPRPPRVVTPKAPPGFAPSEAQLRMMAGSLTKALGESVARLFPKAGYVVTLSVDITAGTGMETMSSHVMGNICDACVLRALDRFREMVTEDTPTELPPPAMLS